MELEKSTPMDENKGLGSKAKSPEEGRCVQWLKRCEYYNEDEDNSLYILKKIGAKSHPHAFLFL